MKYEAEIEGREVTVELEQRDGRVSAKVEGRVYDLSVVRPDESAYLFFAGDQVYEARVWDEGAGSIRVNRFFNARVIDRKHRRASVGHSLEGRQQLLAPMPGKVVRVLLQPGDEVASGQGVVVVEAMKMQNEIKSPKAGRVAEIRVSEGVTVNANQVLAVVE
jgi:biotin carboxyl carrier protein